MQIYLLKDLPGKGKAGEVITVNDGYGKNYLVKNKIGVVADAGILAKVKAKRESDDFRMNEEKSEIKGIVEMLAQTVVTLKAKVGESGKMFGSITGTEVARALMDAGFNIDKRDIILPEAIKSVGNFTVKVKFAYGIGGQFTLAVVGE